MTPNIKLFVCCHKYAFIPHHPLLYPVQAGSALFPYRIPDFAADDTGVNISDKNDRYCELTAQYWAWKNITADYYGFFHYRRYLYPDQKANRPYMVAHKPDHQLLKKLRYDSFPEVITQYDIIAPIGEDMYISVRQHYAMAPSHHIKDLALMEKILEERNPEMVDAMNQYLSNTICYFGNIYIMRREIFQDYCAWLFPLLEEFDVRTDIHKYAMEERRVDGYLSERLFGIYLTHYRMKFNVLELPRVHFYPGNWQYLKCLLLNTILPPGTKSRYKVKSWRNKLIYGRKNMPASVV